MIGAEDRSTPETPPGQGRQQKQHGKGHGLDIKHGSVSAGKEETPILPLMVKMGVSHAEK